MIMQKLGKFFYRISAIVMLVVVVMTSVSCRNNDEPEKGENERTLFMYFPWSVDLTSFFYQNVNDMKKAIANVGLDKQRVVVYFATSGTEAEMYELKYEKGKCVQQTLKTYSGNDVTTPEGIAEVLNDMKAFAPAKRYAMTIGCHGMGWLPVDKDELRRKSGLKYHWETPGVPLTRYFGAGGNKDYQTEITDFAEGLKMAGLKMDYILFDDCYMSSIEVAYDLREVTDYLVGSTCEIMAYGMPYEKIGPYLLGEPDLGAVCDEFYKFYSNYSTPCGTLAVTDCSQVENLAQVMKEINSQFTFDDSLIDDVQRLDGYRPSLFLDFGDYVDHLCTDEALLSRFHQQLDRTVIHKVHTEQYYSMSMGFVTIRTFSGITVSDPSQHRWAAKKTETAWYKATH